MIEGLLPAGREGGADRMGANPDLYALRGLMARSG